jgi:hypothetical protein
MRNLCSILAAAGLSLSTLGCLTPNDEIIEYVKFRPDLEVRTYQASVQNGSSDQIEINLPEGVQSILIEVKGSTGKYRMTKFYNKDMGEITEGGKYKTSFAREVNGLVDWLYPNSPELKPLVGGKYKLVVYGEDPTGGSINENIDVKVYVKKKTEHDTCNLHLDFLIDKVAIDPAVRDRAFDEFIVPWINDKYYQVGVGIKDYTTTEVTLPTRSFKSDVPESLTKHIDDILADARSRQLARSDSIHLVVAQEVGGTSDPLGYSMGLPGPFDADRPNAAVLVGTFGYVMGGDTLDPLGLGSTIVHEVGHFLGLYHASESDGDDHDPIKDTPECSSPPDSGCTEVPGKQPYRTNIMASGTGKDRVWISDGQGFVVRNHPLCAPGDIRQPVQPEATCSPMCTGGLTCTSVAANVACRKACVEVADCELGQQCVGDDLGRQYCK